MKTSNQQITLNVQGMTCRSCAAHVERALAAVPGVESASVNLAARTAVVNGRDFAASELFEAVQEAGYMAQEAESLTFPQGQA